MMHKERAQVFAINTYASLSASNVWLKDNLACPDV